MPVLYNHEYTQRLRAAFIGCGGHALRNIYPTFQYAPVDLVAVCDLDQDRARAVARQFGNPRTYSDHHAMLATEKPDVVFIVTNYDENALPRYPALAEDCLLAGAHAWIEKPPAASVQQIQRLQEISARTGRYVGVGFKKMFFPANVKAKEISHLPEFGRITSIVSRYRQDLPPLSDRGDTRKMVGFLDHFMHPHSLLRLLGGDLDWLFVNRSGVNGAAVVSLRFKNGIVGTLHFSAGQSQSSFLERTEIIGEGANAIVDNNIRVQYFRPTRGPAYGREGDFFGAIENAPLLWEPEFSLGTLHNKALFLLGYAPEIIAFTTRLLEGKGPEYGTLDDAAEMMRIYDAYRQPDETIQRVGAPSGTTH